MWYATGGNEVMPLAGSIGHKLSMIGSSVSALRL